MAKRVHKEHEGEHYVLGTHFLVVCPRCAARAEMHLPTGSDPRSHRLVCPACGLAKGVPSKYWTEQPGRDPFFGLPLWLQTNCCGRVLWAYGPEHLAQIESYVAAELRERRRHPVWGWSNRSVESRLPRWVVAGKNREEVLKGARRLKRRLVQDA